MIHLVADLRSPRIEVKKKVQIMKSMHSATVTSYIQNNQVQRNIQSFIGSPRSKELESTTSENGRQFHAAVVV